MKKSVERESHGKDEAMLNEQKGLLFEFLVALTLAKKYNFELPFWDRISERERQILTHAEAEFYQQDQLAHKNLRVLADNLIRSESHLFNDQIKNIRLVGEHQQSMNDEFSEADLLIEYSDRVIPLSLKLVKKNSWINTKSAGIRTMLSRYFPVDEQMKQLEAELNLTLDAEFSTMMRALCELNEIEYYHNWKAHWLERGLPELPGELSDEMHQYVQIFYHRVAIKLASSFSSYLATNREEFSKALSRLVGLSDEHILQLFCLHSGTDSYQFQGSLFLNEEFWHKEIIDISIVGCSDENSFFEIKMPSSRLQIRVKPMNVFTVPALKVNCSIKLL